MTQPGGGGSILPPRPSTSRVLAAVALALVVGFLLIQSPPAAMLFRWVAEALALCAGFVLRVIGFPIVISGIELRDLVTDHAVAVTEACDGSGLLVATVAVFLWLGIRSNVVRAPVLVGVLAILGIFSFNLVRVVVLFLSIGAPEIMAAAHLFIAPLLSVPVVALVAMVGRTLGPRDLLRWPWVWLAVAVLGAAAWYVMAEAVTCFSTVPLANLLLWILPGDLEGAIACGPSGTMITTSAVVSANPLRVLDVPFFPADFTLAMPLVLASLAMCRTAGQVVRGVLLCLGLFVVATTLAAITASQDAAVAAGATTLMGSGFQVAFHRLGDIWLGLFKVLQNAVVHFSLFVLPLVLLETNWLASRAGTAQPRRSRR